MSHPYNYLVCFFLPISTCIFLSTGTHSISATLLWTLPCWMLLFADWYSPALKETANTIKKNEFYDAILYGLVFFQLLMIVLMLNYVSQLAWNTRADFLTGIVNVVVIRFLVGTCSGISGVVVAHELMHRSRALMQRLAQLVLWTLCYDHFRVVHTQCHHQGVKLQDDFTTARLGESFKAYWKRVCFKQLFYAWRVEQQRLTIVPHYSNLKKILKNKVLHGILIQILIVTLIFYCFGWIATGLFLYQGLIAVRIIESINYVQHWGLDDKRYSNTFGWVSDSAFTRYLLLGLANHIGHHQDENQPYYQITYSNQGPKMPYGYLVMNLWAKLHNPSYQVMAMQALEQYRTRQLNSIKL